MFETILHDLTLWRNQTAQREGVELFRVLPNKTLEELARRRPRDKEEMTAISGIKEAKFRKYGRDLLRIINCPGAGPIRTDRSELNYFKEKFAKKSAAAAEQSEHLEEPLFEGCIPPEATRPVLEVSEFLDRVNLNLAHLSSRIRGEVSSVDERAKAVYFSLKDKTDESVVNCLIFRYQYDVLGLRLEEGMQIVAEGCPEVYKPYGKLSFKADSVELEGEGVLKKEYDMLKQRLEAEGLFAETAKRKLEALPQRIGLITSREGAAIGDFISNVGRYGLSIKFVNSSVEGKRAVFELLAALRALRREKIDVLVIIRGGGSLESLQAFNNEALIRAAKACRVPVVCGVGHDRDISLLSLAADYSVSTPTAAAKLIGSMWELELGKLELFERNILASYEQACADRDWRLKGAAVGIESGFRGILDGAETRFERFAQETGGRIGELLTASRARVDAAQSGLASGFARQLSEMRNRAAGAENSLRLNDPRRQLRLGYGIISRNGASIRSVENLTAGETVKLRVWDGEAGAVIKTIKKHKQ